MQIVIIEAKDRDRKEWEWYWVCEDAETAKDFLGEIRDKPLNWHPRGKMEYARAQYSNAKSFITYRIRPTEVVMKNRHNEKAA